MAKAKRRSTETKTTTRTTAAVGADDDETRAQRPASTSAVLSRKRSLSATLPAPDMSFQERQRLNAMQMEFFGFAGWLASTFFYVMFLVWAYVPDATLKAYGITYFPAKHWAVAIPAMIVMTYLFSLVAYKAVNMKWTPTLDSYATVLDAHSVFLDDVAIDAHADAATPPISDIPLIQVNDLLFRAT